MPVLFLIKHALPGRLRVSLPTLLYDAERLVAVAEHLKRVENVTTVRANRHCASIIIEYSLDTSATYEAVLQELESLDIEKMTEVSAPSSQSNDSDQMHEPRVPGKFPIATLSLMLNLFGLRFASPLIFVGTLYAAWPTYMRAWQVWQREHRLNVDFLDSVSITLSLARRQFFTASLIAWLISLGDAIRDRTAARSQRVIDDLLEYRAQHCWVIRDGKKVQLSITEVAVDDCVVVYAGSLIPVDGEVVKGTASVDQKTITGESLPVVKHVGNSVYAGTAVGEGKLYVRAKRVGTETLVARIVQSIKAAPVGETRTQNYAERFADRLVVPTLALAGGLYAISGDLNRLLSMVIVDYGTGIRVAAPTAILASMTHAARQGVVIKSGSDIEKLAVADTIVFDKTGTVTQGTPHIAKILIYDEPHFSQSRLLALAAAAEARLNHPIAQAIVDHAVKKGLHIPPRESSAFRIGYGVEAIVEGMLIIIGNERFLRNHAIHYDRALADLNKLNDNGLSPLLMAVDGKLVALFAFEDAVRAEMAAVVTQLRQRRIRRLYLLTGDNRRIAQRVSDSLGFDGFYAEVLPHEKADIVQSLQGQGHTVAMVGDGVNDSPALAFADIGISMANGADITRETANVVLLEHNLHKLVLAIDLSRGAMGLVRQNFTIIAGLNTLALALAIPSGYVSPGSIAAISNGSAILASLNAIRPVLAY